MNPAIPRLVGMVHLLALPGSPRFAGSMDEIIETAAKDAAVLVDAGFPALMVENFGDVPFHSDSVPAETVAAMTAAAIAIASAGVPFGVNVLRNDGLSALGVAAATGARFTRVNVLTGMMHTDQGPVVGKAAQIQRTRVALCPEVEIWADVLVKHATPPPGSDPTQIARDTVERGLADAVIVSGTGTGARPDLERARIIGAAVPDGTRIVIGSGASGSNLGELLEVADTVIVGSDIKTDGLASNRPDPLRASSFVSAAGKHGLL